MRLAALLILVGALAACGSSGPPAGGSAELTVHVGVFGGPMLPNGHMAASNTPQQGARITVSDRSGHTWTARTDRSGTASFDVPPGHYFVHAPCGQADAQGYAVRAGQPARVRVQCDVP